MSYLYQTYIMAPPFVPEVGEALQRTIRRRAPDLLVVSGDLTQRAKPAQFAEARTYLDRLPPIPRVIVPGTHDVPLCRVWERFFQPYGLYRKYIAEEF
jgi:3',5'-cyclic AMP phosphodiesterase CpdA